MGPNRLRTEGVPQRQTDVALDAALCVTFAAPQSRRAPTRRAASVLATGRWIYALVHTWMVQLTRAPPPHGDTFHEWNHFDPDFAWI
jgi:hypothetical protein